MAATRPKITEIVVSYSAGCKANLGHGTYESADFHISRTEKYDVTGMTPAAVGSFWNERYEELKEEMDDLIVGIHDETSKI